MLVAHQDSGERFMIDAARFTIKKSGERLYNVHLIAKSVDEALNTIQKITQFGITWSKPGLVKGTEKVTIEVEQGTLYDIMVQFCEGQGFTFNIREHDVVLVPREGVPPAMPITKGIHLRVRVINQLLEPVPGAIVTDPLTGRSKRTNGDGECYFDTIEPGNFLIIKGDSINSQPIRVPSNRVTITIKVQEEAALMPPVEVIYTGYQQFMVRAGTGSNFIVSSEVLQKQTSPNVLDRLEGNIPSLLSTTNRVPGTYQSEYVVIGGRTTLIAGADPLFIVDNFPFQGDPRSINPDDIENITVLRDATAAAIWGARSANGVIVITTKSAKFNHPLRISFNNFIGIAGKPDVFYEDRMSSSDRIWVDSFLFKNGYFNGLVASPLHPALSPVAELLYDRSLTDAQRTAIFNRWRVQDNRYDLEKYFYRRSLSEHMSAQIAGSSRINAFFLSAGYDRSHPELRLSKQQRITVKSDHIFRPLSGLEIFTSASYLQNKHYDIDGLPSMSIPYASLSDYDTAALFQTYKYRAGYIDTAGGGRLLNWKYSPRQEFNLRNNTSVEQDIRLAGSIKYKNFPGLLQGLEAAVFLQKEIVQNSVENIYDKQSFLVRDLVNSYSQITSAAVNHVIPWDNISDQTVDKSTTDNLRFMLTYIRNWDKECALSIMAGRDEIRTHGNYVVDRIYGDKANRLDYVNSFPIYYFPLLKLQVPQPSKEKQTNTSYLSNYINGNFEWKGRYFLSGSLRLDKSSFYGPATNDKQIPLVCAGVGWEISSEPFYKNSWLPLLKLRATYGTTGNAPEGATAIQTISRSGNNVNGDPMVVFNNPPLPSLRWEKVNTFNIGLNLHSTGDRIEAIIDWYSKTGRDLIGFKSLDPSSGNTSLIGNVAAMKSRNVDIILETKNLCRGFQWNTGVLFSYVKEKVKHAEDKPQPAWMYCDREYFSVVQGKPLYGVYSFAFKGLDPKGNPMGINNREDYSNMLLAPGSDSLIYHGRSSPPVFGSLTNEFKWKQISIAVMLLYKFGYFFRKASVNYYEIFNGAKGSSDFDRRWQKPGDENATNVPSIPQTVDQNRDLFYNYSEALIARADHIRFQNIQLSFYLEGNLLKRLGLRMGNLYCNASNLGIIWRANKYNIDPDKLSGYPQPAIFTIGFKGTFK